MKLNNLKTKKAQACIFQILILVLGIFAFAYLVGGATPAEIEASQWTTVCNTLGDSGEKVGTLNVESIKQLEVIQNLPYGSTSYVIPKMDEKSLVQNCRNNPAALAKLDDNTLLTGINNNMGELFEGDKSIFGASEKNTLSNEISNRIGGKNKADFLKEFNKAENNLARKGWLDDFSVLDVQGDNAPEVLSFDKKSGVLELAKEKEWTRTIDTKSLENGKFYGEGGMERKINMKISEDGEMIFNNGINGEDGTKISEGHAKIGFDKGLTIDAEEGTTVDLSSTDFSSVGSDVNINSKLSTVYYKEEEYYRGTFEGAFGKRGGEDFRQFNFKDNEAFVNFGDNYGQFSASGKKMTIKGDIIDINGRFKPGDITVYNPIRNTIESDKAVIFRGEMAEDQLVENAMNVKLNPRGFVEQVKILGSRNGVIEGPISQTLQADLTGASKGVLGMGDGTLNLENAGKVVKLENGRIIGGKNLDKILQGDGMMNFQYESSGKIINDYYYLDNDGNLDIIRSVPVTRVVATPSAPSGQQVGAVTNTNLKSKFKEFINSDKTKTGFAIAGLAAVAGGAYLLYEALKDKDKD